MKMFLLLALALTGCGDKTATTNNGTAGSGSAITENTKVPDDDTSRAFAEKLLSKDVVDFKPTDNNSDAAFIYKTVHFKPNNGWEAAAKMYAQGEEIDCAERGTWEMDKATSNNSANVTLTVDYTNCPGRPSNNIMRLNFTFDNGGWKIGFR